MIITQTQTDGRSRVHNQGPLYGWRLIIKSSLMRAKIPRKAYTCDRQRHCTTSTHTHSAAFTFKRSHGVVNIMKCSHDRLNTIEILDVTLCVSCPNRQRQCSALQQSAEPDPPHTTDVPFDTLGHHFGDHLPGHSVIFVNENENENAKAANLLTQRKC